MSNAAKMSNAARITNGLISRFMLLVKVSRPILWVICPLVFFMGLFSSGIDKALIYSFMPMLQLLMLLFPFNIFLYGINDIYDYESDKLNPRKNLLEGLKLHPKYHTFVKNISLAIMALLFLVSLFTFNAGSILAMALLLFFSYFYSAPPFRLKEKPPLDSLSNGMIYFFAPYLLGFSFGGSVLELSYKVYVISLCAAAGHCFSTIMDYSSDKKAGNKTFAVVFGKRAAAITAFFVSVLALVFGRFETPAINYYISFCAVMFFIAMIFPNEKLAELFTKLAFIGFVAAGVLFVFF